jgi:Protein of unknown function (DUF1553)/Protein of unknown function (DUF1549)
MRMPRLSPGTAFAVLLGGLGLFLGVTALAEDPAPGPSGPPEPTWTSAQKSHWAYVPPKRPARPGVKQSGWIKNPIDAFILSELEGMEVAPTPEADRATLIRRVKFDLTGLPPTPEEVEAFVKDARPDAYDRVVDGLLATDQYGERWARLWLDLARFAESDGFKSDKTRPFAWRYRDWVIRALNRDLPYDRFVALQIAGDELAPDDPEAFVATGFNRNYPFEDNNMVAGLNRQLMLEDLTDTTASVFLGMTLACARCHNHKYDPISQKDYYRFQALFAASTAKDDAPLVGPMERAYLRSMNSEHNVRLDWLQKAVNKVERPYLAALLKDRLETLPKEVRQAFATDPDERSAFQEDLLRKFAKDMTVPKKTMESAMKPADRQTWTELTSEMTALAGSLPADTPTGSGMTDTGTQSPPVRLFVKGNLAVPAETVGPGFPSLFATLLPPFEEHPTATTSGRRKALAEWLTRPEHPLTARVMVNRLWQNHFGRGIVATTSDFGTQGTEPSHPLLLDWLATEFIRTGWSQKAMHRLMVTSATYRQSSTPSAETLEADPDNTLFSRMFRRRLEGEAVRDALLASSGLLDTRIGGPSVFPDLPPGIETRGGWTRSTAASDRNRRSIYVFVRRNLKYPLFDAFDFPDTNTTCAERNVTVNAPQALTLLNSDLVLEQARAFAGRLLKTAADRNDPNELVTSSYKLALGRAPRPEELSRGVAFLTDQPGVLSSRADDPRSLDLPTPMPDGYGPARGAALVDYCHVILNLNEFVFVD